MEIFGWIILALFAALGVILGIFMILPYILTTLDSVKFKRAKLAELSRIDTEERIANQKIRQAKIREKDEMLAEKKNQLQLMKLNKKIAAQNEAIAVANAQEQAKEVAEKEVVSKKASAIKTIEEAEAEAK